MDEAMTDRAVELPEDGASDHAALIRRLRRENLALREELQRLSVYRVMAYHDCLTGLHNRRYFEERLHEECARAARNPAHVFSVIMVDVDEFKRANDEHGHAVGDEVLVAVARFIKDNVREVDICCRLGGDEFAILLPNTPESGCRVVVDRLRMRLAAGRIEAPLPVELSLGAAASPPSPSTPEAVMERADAAMYMEKRSRRLPPCFASA